MKVKVCVLGHFGEGLNLLNGQTIKTKIITDELQNQLGQDQVMKIDTHGGLKTLLKAPYQVIKSLKKSDNIVIFPAHKGLRVYAPLLFLFRKVFFKNSKLHYVVIGGWLLQFLLKYKGLAKLLKNFDGIYVETNTMKMALEEQGFRNVFVMPNCKKLHILSEEELVYPTNMPYKLCTFSRVMKEKGIEDAVNAVMAVNEHFGYLAFSLDIYGQVDSEQTEWFEDLQKRFPHYIRYGGMVPFDKSVDVLKDYFALLFPTRFYTEGIPGTIIDAYSAGIPVIASRWENYFEIVDDSITGIGYSFNSEKQFEEILKRIANNAHLIVDMKKKCTDKAKNYLPNEVARIIVEQMN